MVKVFFLLTHPLMGAKYFYAIVATFVIDNKFNRL